MGMNTDFHRAAGAKREMMSEIGYDVLSRDETEGEALSDGGDQQVAFHEGEVIADADAWSRAEGNLG